MIVDALEYDRKVCIRDLRDSVFDSLIRLQVLIHVPEDCCIDTRLAALQKAPAYLAVDGCEMRGNDATTSSSP